MQILVMPLIMLIIVGSNLVAPKHLSENTKPSDIEVYSASNTNFDYIEICEIEVNDGSDITNMRKAKEKAREVGADAIIIKKNISKGINKSVKYSISSAQDSGLKAIAIKYN
ncbi:MAG: hypothetical protein LHV68_01130 [Elusimicrobia bacterium]|nr:hypothetical protein [Candidatus Liberimonas magnetica]